MARHERGAAAEALGELESAADRLSDWLQANIRAVAIAIAVLLIASGVAAWIVNARQGAEQDASAALARTRDDYLSAMGAAPGAIEVPELANREAASQIRREYERRFGEVADEHAGTVAGTLAQLERARLATEDGQEEEATALLETALGQAPAGAVRGMVLQRLAQRLEVAGRWEEAAQRHQDAAAVAAYPLRGWALADAARCRASAGDPAGALALYERLEREFPKLKLPDDQSAEILELRAVVSEG